MVLASSYTKSRGTGRRERGRKMEKREVYIGGKEAAGSYYEVQRKTRVDSDAKEDSERRRSQGEFIAPEM